MWRVSLKQVRLSRAFLTANRQFASRSQGFTSKIDVQHAAAAYRIEFQKLSVLSKLINQSTPAGLEGLEDVHGMMFEYTNLVAQGAVVKSMSNQVARALSQSARDCSVLLRKLPKRERDRITFKVLGHIKDYTDQVAEDIIQKRIPRDLQTLGTLLSVYEIIDPVAGLQFFRHLDALEVTGSAMPCMIKAGCSLQDIKDVYDRAPTKSDWVKAHMVRAYLEHGELGAAVELYDNISTHNMKIQSKLDDLIIGEGPIEKAQEVFSRISTAPRSPVMMRYLASLWEVSHDLEDQFKAFRRYLDLVHGNSDAPLVGPTQALIQHIFAANKQDITALESSIQRLARLFEAKPQVRTMLLNVTLTELSRNLPTELDLAAKLMIEYGAENDPVSYRVRLNALELVDFAEKRQLIVKLWAARVNIDRPLTALDWIALGRSDGFGETFKELWQASGEPFSRDLRNYQRSFFRN